MTDTEADLTQFRNVQSFSDSMHGAVCKVCGSVVALSEKPLHREWHAMIRGALAEPN